MNGVFDGLSDRYEDRAEDISIGASSRTRVLRTRSVAGLQPPSQRITMKGLTT